MIKDVRGRIRDYTTNGVKTLLGVGPMSQNVVDVTLELACNHDIPLMLIASRRQIDSAKHGGGYVNNWTTEQYSSYVKNMEGGRIAVLARDHGGPWQNNLEIENCLDINQAMSSAKSSYEADIDAGFEILHIDPSIGLNSPVSPEESLERALELYQHCWDYAQKSGKDIAFEIGTEEQQAGGVAALDLLEQQLFEIHKFCKISNIPLPLYVVVQTGTKVMELRNVGSFDAPVRVSGEVPSEILVPKIVELCEKFSIFLKQHNTDYLSDYALRAHPSLGIHAANVAPEFGVAETRAYFELMDNFGLGKIKDNFIEIALKSKKWEKWMLPGSVATDFDKAIICGHYIFGSSAFSELRNELNHYGKSHNIDVDNYLKLKIKESIMRYLVAFRLVKARI